MLLILLLTKRKKNKLSNRYLSNSIDIFLCHPYTPTHKTFFYAVGKFYFVKMKAKLL